MARTSDQEVAAKFEERVRALIKALGFTNVGGGPKLILGGQQIDACCGFEDTLILIECKTGRTAQTRMIDHIRKIRGQMERIKTDLKEHGEFSRYTDIRYVIATNFDVRPEHVEEARKVAAQTIEFWDQQTLSYYERLVPRLDEYAKFNLLGELGVKPRVGHEEKFPCIKVQLTPKVTGYMFVAHPKNLLKWVYVARREIGQELFYQRFIEQDKIGRIATYLDKGNYLPNAAIIAFNQSPKFMRFREVEAHFPNWPAKQEFGCLSFPAEYRSCWIIDGQHRLYGAGRQKNAGEGLPIVALENVNLQEQAQLFLDINKNQKAVAADLVWDLEGEMRPQSPEGVIARVAKALNESGPLEGKIAIPFKGNKGRGLLKLAGVCSAIQKNKLTGIHLRSNMRNPFYDQAPDVTVKRTTEGMRSALSALATAFDEEALRDFWFQNSGIAVFFALHGKIVDRFQDDIGETHFSKCFQGLRSHLEPLTKERLKELRQRCSSEAGRDSVFREFATAIGKRTGDDSFSAGIAESKLEKRIGRVERGIAKLVQEHLSKADYNWLNSRVPQQIREHVENKTKVQEDAPHLHFSLGQVAQVVKQANNWKDLDKIVCGKGLFTNAGEFDAAAAFINRTRATLVHDKGELAPTEGKLLDAYLGQFEAVLQRASGAGE